jgi:hypothetical protein
MVGVERRQAGRIDAASEVATLDAEEMVNIYRALVEHSDLVLSEIGEVTSAEQARLIAYRHQLARQLAHWRRVHRHGDTAGPGR